MDVSSIIPGSLHVITGGMKGGKTPIFISVLDRLKRAGRQIQVFKPESDNRERLHEKFNVPREYVISRTGANYPAEIVKEDNPYFLLGCIKENTQVIGIEEVMLLNDPDSLVNIVQKLRYANKAVVVSGLDKNFRGEPFHPMPILMAHASKLVKSYGICDIVNCDLPGEFPQRLMDGVPADYNSPILLVGEDETYGNVKETYEIRCIHHHKVPGRPEY